MLEKIKRYIQKRLEKYVVQYFQAHPEVELICVVGSVGKTATKNQIATVLDFKYRVGGGFGNHNTELSAPLAILGVKYPENVRSISQWRKVFKACELRINQPATVDVIVQELGIDKPGDMATFGRYLKPDLAVVTAVTPEHMENFESLEQVAQEELSVAEFAKKVLINRDDVPGEFSHLINNPNIITYGSSSVAEYSYIIENFSPNLGYKGRIIGPNVGEDNQGIPINVMIFGDHLLKSVVAAVTVGIHMAMTGDELVQAAARIRPTSGRMNFLPGARGSLIIDDTYNSSPQSATAALRTLYSLSGSQRIAALGSMNELGQMSESAHRELGELCNPSQLDWVVTVGDDANNYLAPAAEKQGCSVKKFKTSVEAGIFIRKVLKYDAVVLFKGSQNGIFIEEAIKAVLADNKLSKHLVRQSLGWMDQKQEFFSNSIGKNEGEIDDKEADKNDANLVKEDND